MVLILHVLSHVALRRESKPATRFTMSQVFTLDVGLGTLVILRSLGWGGFWEVGGWGTASVPSGSAFFGMTSQSWGTIAHGQQKGKKMAQWQRSVVLFWNVVPFLTWPRTWNSPRGPTLGGGPRRSCTPAACRSARDPTRFSSYWRCAGSEASWRRNAWPLPAGGAAER